MFIYIFTSLHAGFIRLSASDISYALYSIVSTQFVSQLILVLQQTGKIRY